VKKRMFLHSEWEKEILNVATGSIARNSNRWLTLKGQKKYYSLYNKMA
jgi:hypothetical protein